jgi:hypothetical protein
MKKVKGLAGTKCALEHSKTMKKGGPKPMIRSMKSYAMGGESEMTSAGPIKRKLKRAWRNFKNTIKNPGGGSHTPRLHKPNCGGPGHYC